MSGSLEPDTSEGDWSIAHLMLDLGLKSASLPASANEAANEDPLLLELAPEVIYAFLGGALHSGHVAIVRFSQEARATGLTPGTYRDATTLQGRMSELRRALLRTQSHALLPFTAWLVSQEAENDASRAIDALAALPDDEGLFAEALALCTATIDLFPSFADLFLNSGAPQPALGWLRAAILRSPLEVAWRVQT